MLIRTHESVISTCLRRLRKKAARNWAPFAEMRYSNSKRQYHSFTAFIDYTTTSFLTLTFFKSTFVCIYNICGHRTRHTCSCFTRYFKPSPVARNFFFLPIEVYSPSTPLIIGRCYVYWTFTINTMCVAEITNNLNLTYQCLKMQGFLYYCDVMYGIISTISN